MQPNPSSETVRPLRPNRRVFMAASSCGKSMNRFDDLAAFAAVVRARSFTRAAAQLGVSQSALSQTVRTLERRLDLKLLNRTTRSVSPTEAGERLYQSVAPRFAEFEAELA